MSSASASTCASRLASRATVYSPSAAIVVVGLTAGDTLIAGECTFRRSPLGYDALSTLEDHVAERRWTPTDGGSRDEEYALFSRSGFKPSVQEAATERTDPKLFTVDDVVAAV